MTHSIRRQLALIFIGLMAGTILLCWLMNNIFLEQYYIRSKTEVISAAYIISRSMSWTPIPG